MKAKAQLDPTGLSASPAPAIFEAPQASITSDKSSEAIAGRPDVLRNVDAAWLFESSPDAVVLVDAQGRIAVVNAQTERMFGYRREELVGEPVEKLVPERFPYSAAPHTRPLRAGLDLFGRHRDGYEFPIEISLAPLETEEGVLISSAIRDVKDLKRTQELQSSLEFEKLMSRLSQAFLNLPVERIDSELNNGLKDLAEVLDLDRVKINLFGPDHKSRTVAYMWSRPGIPPPPPEKIINEAFPWLSRSIASREVCCVSAPEDLPEEASSEREYMLSMGLQSWLEIPLLVGGVHLATIGTGIFRRRQSLSPSLISRFQQAGELFASVLERRHAVEVQRESEERFRTVANTAPVMIWMSGTDKLCTFFNQGWLAFTGRTMEQECGEGWASGVHPEDLNRCLQIYSEAFDARAEFRMEYRLRSSDGGYHWIFDSGVPRFESNGAFRGYIGSCIDITDRKLSEQALLETTERLAEANKQIAKLNQRLEKENVYLREEAQLEHHHDEVIGDSESIRRVLKRVEQVASTDSTVLVLGETGTGKELIARAIHERSRRRNRVMVKVNCAALPASLIESELFGREKGAFTGALTREIGRFELANGSTILLDEVGELPVELQSKLLRVLQEGEFERLGSPKTIKVDARVIAATSKNLQQAVREGKFREDLFYRLNVFPITIPPLRERREDIPPLVWHFVNSLSQRMGRSIETVQASTMEAFKSYYWPGNVRELRNVIERFLITSTNTVFRAKLPTDETAPASVHSQTFEDVERTHILHVMEMVGWRVRGEGGAAQILGLKPTTLESRMQKLGIVRHK
jgi:formate hydrogenlyase transcriptional activator